MLTISKPLSGGQARTYHAREFAAKEANYWSREQQGHSEWQGKLAQEWGLQGEVGAEQFARLTEGQHPDTQEQMVRHQPAKTYENQFGREVTSVEHRAGWDATFSAPKSVSLTALVGGDERVREAHRESVRVALGELERYTQARLGNVNAPELTGKFAAATFEHDTARPVAGYAAPQLHTHAVVFNVTERENGRTRAVDARSLFGSQQFATSVYRTELASRLQNLGYEIERGKHGQPEIKGYTPEYLEASSPRREQIKSHLQEIGREGAGAAQVAAHRTRDSKEIQPPAEVLHRHRELAAQHGHQADWVVSKALANAHRQEVDSPKMAQQAVTYARDHVFERSAVQDERAILQSAMDRSMGQASASQVRAEFDRRTTQGEFRTSRIRRERQASGTRRPPCCAWSGRRLHGCRKGTGPRSAMHPSPTPGPEQRPLSGIRSSIRRSEPSRIRYSRARRRSWGWMAWPVQARPPRLRSSRRVLRRTDIRWRVSRRPAAPRSN